MELSMGMTADYDEAVIIFYCKLIYQLKRGATIIRIGTAIFG